MKNGCKDFKETQRWRSVSTIGMPLGDREMSFPLEDKHTLDPQDSPTSEMVLLSGKGLFGDMLKHSVNLLLR